MSTFALIDLYHRFLVIDGMPRVVREYTETVRQAGGLARSTVDTTRGRERPLAC